MVPGTPAAVAVTVLLLVPAVVPRVQLVSVAMPRPSVATTAGVAGTMLPPPRVRLNVTFTPATGLLSASVTLTDGRAATAVATVADWEVTEIAAMLPAPAAVPEALNVMVARPEPVAVTVLLLTPAVFPSVQVARVATPDPLVLTVAGLAGTMLPWREVTVNITAKVETALPLMSVTLTEGGVTAVPTGAL